MDQQLYALYDSVADRFLFPMGEKVYELTQGAARALKLGLGPVIRESKLRALAASGEAMEVPSAQLGPACGVCQLPVRMHPFESCPYVYAVDLDSDGTVVSYELIKKGRRQ